MVKGTDVEATQCIRKAGGNMVIVGLDLDRQVKVSEFQIKQVLHTH